MGFTVSPQKSIVEVHSLQGLQRCSNLAGPSFGVVSCSALKGSSFYLNCSMNCSYRNQLYSQGKEFLRSGRTLFSLQCRGVESVSIDRVEENDQDDWSLGSHVSGSGRDFRVEMTTRNHGSSILFADGPLVENDEETNNEILQNLCKNGSLMEATKLIDIMSRINQIPNSTCSTNLIRGLIRIGRIERASRVLKTMVMSGLVPDVITYNMMVGGFCKRRQFRSAIDLLEDMSLSGCPPDVITYNTIIRSLFDDGKFDQAVEFWKGQLRRGCLPYLIPYTILIELVWKHCGTTRALEVLEDMAIEGCYPDLVTYNSLVNFASKEAVDYGMK
ncbi:hypothetical protein OIU85_003716 [Salix viminalis]|uniref:Pentacotripeptide-repeat region of PRORP domain-containing protein n=1 Tax=Salix viminalis TaxID=40686 RepID=A0A9Q0Q098_SALVM|nr:hypothetical protein OIU85_003716 [Salix viminalis]